LTAEDEEDQCYLVYAVITVIFKIFVFRIFKIILFRIFK